MSYLNLQSVAKSHINIPPSKNFSELKCQRKFISRARRRYIHSSRNRSTQTVTDRASLQSGGDVTRWGGVGAADLLKQLPGGLAGGRPRRTVICFYFIISSLHFQLIRTFSRGVKEAVWVFTVLCLNLTSVLRVSVISCMLLRFKPGQKN